MAKKFNLMGPGSKSDKIPYTLEDMKRFYTMNTGNMLFYYACENITNLDYERYGWGGKPEIINKYSNGILIPMANQVGSHFNLQESGPKIIDINKPIIVLGLGVQFDLGSMNIDEIPEGTIAWLKELSRKTTTKNIAVRGIESKKVLDQLGFGDSVEALGCPSLLINKNMTLGKKIFKKFTSLSKDDILHNMSIAAGDPYKINLSTLERSLIKMVDDYGARYTVQNPALLLKLSSGWYNDIDTAELNMLQKRWFTHLTHSEIVNWFVKNSDVYFSIPQWIYNYSRKNFVIGTRIHGIQAAIQAGTPAICLYIDIRTKELCEMMKIPHAPASDYLNGITINDIIDIFNSWDYLEFDRNRISLAKKMKSFLQINSIEINNSCILKNI